MSAQSTGVDDDDVIYDLVLNAYNKLPSKGKPKLDEEWTHLAAVVLEAVNAEGVVEFRDVIAVGTGTKCVGRSKLVANGTIVRDSHAEIIARRCFMVYLYECLSILYGKLQNNTENNVLEFIVDADKTPLAKFRVKPNVRFVFFLTHPPCGDGAIFDKPTTDVKNTESEEDEIGDDVNSGSAPPSKKPRIEKSEQEEGDIYRTGAKCVPDGSLQDPLLPRRRYHVLGALRSKPGRGDPTLSMSCSDKMLKWQLLGLQGALLSYFIAEPIRFHRLVFTKCPMDPSAITRALSLQRLQNSETELIKPPLPKIVLLKRQFLFSRDAATALAGSKARPVATSICYCKNVKNPDASLSAVIVDGFKQGATKKHIGTAKSAPFISSSELFRKFVTLTENLPQNTRTELSLPESSGQLTYAFAKKSSATYKELRNRYVSTIFKGWLLKPKELEEFTTEQKQ